MTTENEINELIAEGWVVTDEDSAQLMKEIVKNEIYLFREDRLIDPSTGETEVFEEEMRWEDYPYADIMEACSPFGYGSHEINKWIITEENIPLMLECIFEMM